VRAVVGEQGGGKRFRVPAKLAPYFIPARYRGFVVAGVDDLGVSQERAFGEVRGADNVTRALRLVEMIDLGMICGAGEKAGASGDAGNRDAHLAVRQIGEVFERARIGKPKVQRCHEAFLAALPSIAANALRHTAREPLRSAKGHVCRRPPHTLHAGEGDIIESE
jgi:hypothetical protein